MPENHFVGDDLAVSVCSNRRDAGVASAGHASAVSRAGIDKNGGAGVVFAAALSQNELLARLRAVPLAVVTVPSAAKAPAVGDALEGPIDPRCPASIPRRHAGAELSLDRDSAALLERNGV